MKEECSHLFQYPCHCLYTMIVLYTTATIELNAHSKYNRFQ